MKLYRPSNSIFPLKPLLKGSMSLSENFFPPRLTLNGIQHIAIADATAEWLSDFFSFWRVVQFFCWQMALKESCGTDEHEVGVRFAYHEYDCRQSRTIRIPLAN